MIAYFVAGALGRRFMAPPGYIGRHRAPRPRYTTTVRLLPVPVPTRVPEVARAQWS